ncbi:MAG: hypothetical protein HY072_01755 [Deltaproteobacteria bacterium]|nr:hypothetical protein [Deltaproteobacteria bacterium]
MNKLDSYIDFSSVDLISSVKAPLHWDEDKTKQFVTACKTMAVFHASFCPEIKALYHKKRFDPDSIQTEADIARIPWLGVSAMKSFLFLSLPEERLALRLTSSGTRGQKTQIWMDHESLARAQKMLDVLWEQEGLISSELTNYLMFVYDPDSAKDLGVAFSDKNQQRFAPIARSFYTVQQDKHAQWAFLKEKTLLTLCEFEKEGKPVRIFGIPAFLYEFLRDLKQSFKLNPQSLVMTGGGWKAAEDKKVSREEFRQMITEKISIPDFRIRDGYGMAEHCASYMDCRMHRFHVPAYNRVFVPGEIGLLELVTPFNTMMPNLAILTTDLGYLDPVACNCGWKSPTFTLVGRGGLTKHKGCAITADEIIKR